MAMYVCFIQIPHSTRLRANYNQGSDIVLHAILFRVSIGPQRALLGHVYTEQFVQI